MKRVTPQETWPESWKYSYAYDLREIYGDATRSGYAHAYRARRETTLRLLTEVLPPGSRILDVAAAQGNFSLTLAEMGFDVTWNDLRENLAGYVQLKHERGTLRYAPGNVFDLEFCEPFDGVLMTEVIEHVAHPDKMLAKVAAMLKPGGWVIMTTPNGRYFRNRLPKFSDCRTPAIYEQHQFKPDADGHIFLLWPDELAALAACAGLQLDRLVLFTNPLTQGHLKTEPLLRVLPGPVVSAIEQSFGHLPRVIQEKCLIQMAVRFRRTLSPAGSTASMAGGRPVDSRAVVSAPGGMK